LFELGTGGIGTKEEKGKRFRLEILAADPVASDRIKGKRQDKSGDVVFYSRPAPRVAETEVDRI